MTRSATVRRLMVGLVVSLLAATTTVVTGAAPANASVNDYVAWSYSTATNFSFIAYLGVTQFDGTGTDVNGVRTVDAYLAGDEDQCIQLIVHSGRGTLPGARVCDGSTVHLHWVFTESFGASITNYDHRGNYLDATGVGLPNGAWDGRGIAGFSAHYQHDGTSTLSYTLHTPGVWASGTANGATVTLDVTLDSAFTGCAYGEIGDVWNLQTSTQTCAFWSTAHTSTPTGRGAFIYAAYAPPGSQPTYVRMQLPV